MNCRENMDNMGGILSAAFVLQKEIEYFAHTNNHCTIKLLEQKEWRKFHSQIKGIVINVSPKRSDAGLLYEISGSINLLKSDPNLDLLRMTQYIVIACKNADLVTKVIGTDEYPLEFTLAPLTPAQTSDFFGWSLSFKGKQLIEPPVLDNIKVL